MADKTKLWKSLPLTISTNVTTAETVVSILGIDAAKSPPSTGEKYSDWTSNIGGEYLKNQYNVANNTNLSQNEFNKIFQKELVPILNNDRASDINSNASEDNRRLFAQSLGVPKVIDPVSGKTVSSSGDPIQNPVAPKPDPLPNFNLEISQETTKVKITTTPSILRYPLNYDTKNNNYDFLKIQVAKYVPGLSGGLQEGTNLAIQSVKTRITDKGTSVILPMYPGISESNSVSWGSDELNPIQASFGAAAYNIINQFGSANFDFGKALQNAGNQLGAAVKNLANTPELQQYISAYFAGRAVGANILGRTTGMVVNPNLELLFKGPQLRSFKYSYRFTPRDNNEAKEIRRIIKFFKREMAVQKNDNHVFLKTPNVFFLDYIFRGTETNIHPFLNKIKPCALTNFNVNYTPDGTYMTYHDGEGKADGSMTSYTVDMQFDELEPIYRDDHSDSLDDPTMGY